MDVDKSGVVHLDELNGWIDGRHLRTERLLTEALLAPRVQAEEEAWDVRRLHTEMLSMLTENGLCASDVFRAWDSDGDRLPLRTRSVMSIPRLPTPMCMHCFSGLTVRLMDPCMVRHIHTYIHACIQCAHRPVAATCIRVRRPQVMTP